MKLNLGSGSIHFDGFLNVDFDPQLAPDVIAAVDKLPFEDESAEEIIASHILEHLPFWSNAIPEWRRVLAPGGTLWVMVPDVVRIAQMAKEGSHYYLHNTPSEWRLMDRQYVNAAVFGGVLLGPPFTGAGQVHRQIFLGTMLEDALSEFFSDVARVEECPIRETHEAEICVRARR